MKNIKVLSLFVLLLVGSLLLTGCGSKSVEGKLEDLMSKVYEKLPEDKTPMMLMNTEVTEENVEYYLGTTEIEFEEALARESGTGSIAHSVVLVRLKDGADVETVKNTIKEKVDPRKWICVAAENVVVKSKGNLVILIMTNDGLEELEEGFNNL